MINRKVRRLETARLAQRNRQRIAHRHRHDRRCRRRQIVQTGLALNRGVERNVRLFRERRLEIAGDRDDRAVHPPQIGHETKHFLRFSAGGDQYGDIALRDHAEIAMRGIGAMNEKAGRTERCERRADFARHETRFADTGNDHPVLARQNEIHSTVEIFVNTFSKLGHGRCVNGQGMRGHTSRSCWLRLRVKPRLRVEFGHRAPFVRSKCDIFVTKSRLAWLFSVY